MNLFALLKALPPQVLAPVAVGVLIAVAVWALRRSRTRVGVALRMADVVARQGSAALAVLVTATALVVFHAGLSQLAVPAPAELAATAADIERVRGETRDDVPSLRARLSQLGAQDERVSWSMLTRTAPCAVACLVASDRRLDSLTAEALARRHAGSTLDRSPVRVGDRVAMAVSAPVRDARGQPDASLLIAFDGTPAAGQAAIAAWVVLGFAALLGALLVRGTRRAVSTSVVERLRELAGALHGAPAGALVRHGAEAESGGDELHALARAVDVAAERLERRDAQYRTLVEQAPVGIAQLDARGVVRQANPRFLSVLDLADATNVPGWNDVFVLPRDAEMLRDAVQRGAPVTSASWQWRRRDGTTRMVRASLVPLSPDSAALGAELLVEDVSEQQALEAQLIRAQKMEIVGRLVGGIAHDFNNLLTVIRGTVMTMGGTEVSPDLGAIDDAAARGARLVRRLLTIGRADDLQLIVQPIGPLLHEAIATVRRVLPARITVSGPTEIPDISIAMDRDAVDQALLNLALNARDAIPGDGTVHFDVTVPSAPEQGLAITCVDNGVGMSAEVIARATEPFFTSKTADAGSGLGLAVVDAIMSRHGGRLEIASAPDRGTRVTLWFPSALASAALPSAGTVVALPSCTVQGLQVLVVDDEEMVRRLTAKVLSAAGCKVVSAGSMREADALLVNGHTLQVVVSDVMMPGGTGVDLFRRVRARGDQVPFLFVSGYAVESLNGIIGTDVRADVLCKPWTGAELTAAIRRVAVPGSVR